MAGMSSKSPVERYMWDNMINIFVLKTYYSLLYVESILLANVTCWAYHLTILSFIRRANQLHTTTYYRKEQNRTNSHMARAQHGH
jgi:hypothetical protein